MRRKAIDLLRSGAQMHWSGSGEHLALVYECLSGDRADRGAGLGAAALISMLLRGPHTSTDLAEWRVKCLRELREKVATKATTRTRVGPKAERHRLAVKALDELDKMAATALSRTPAACVGVDSSP